MRSGWRLVRGVLLACALAMVNGVHAAEDQPNDGKSCGKDEERDGNLCYPICKGDGYTRYEGDGAECWQICPSNSQDYGNVCLMGPAQLKKKMYKRGPGRPLT